MPKHAVQIRPGVSLCPKHPNIERYRPPSRPNQWYCTACETERKQFGNGLRQHREANWRRHGIVGMTWEKWEAMDKQCAICGTTEDLVLDHDHRTGEARGILCRSHNSALGYLGDDLQTMKKVVEYLGGKAC